MNFIILHLPWSAQYMVILLLTLDIILYVEDNVFSGVCQSVILSTGKMGISVQDPSPSLLFTIKHGMLESRQLAFNWNVFLSSPLLWADSHASYCPGTTTNWNYATMQNQDPYHLTDSLSLCASLAYWHNAHVMVIQNIGKTVNIVIIIRICCSDSVISQCL